MIGGKRAVEAYGIQFHFVSHNYVFTTGTPNGNVIPCDTFMRTIATNADPVHFPPNYKAGYGQSTYKEDTRYYERQPHGKHREVTWKSDETFTRRDERSWPNWSYTESSSRREDNPYTQPQHKFDFRPVPIHTRDPSHQEWQETHWRWDYQQQAKTPQSWSQSNTTTPRRNSRLNDECPRPEQLPAYKKDNSEDNRSRPLQRQNYSSQHRSQSQPHYNKGNGQQWPA